MSNYAVVNNNGLIVNMVLWDGEGKWIPGEGLTAEKADDDWVIGGRLEKGKYIAPEKKAPSDEELTSINTQIKISLMEQASEKISVLQDAVDLEMATDSEATALPLWKRYRVLLNRVDANTADTITWPEKPSS